MPPASLNIDSFQLSFRFRAGQRVRDLTRIDQSRSIGFYASSYDIWEIHRGRFVARDIPVIRVEITLKRYSRRMDKFIARLRKAPTDVPVGSANFHARISSTRKSTWAETIGDYVGVSEDRVQILFLLFRAMMRIYNKYVKMKNGSVVFG